MRIADYIPEEHYQELVKVWSRYGWLPCPREFLPRTGAVAVSDSGGFIAALFIYTDPGSVALVDWAVGSRECSREERSEAFRALFERMKGIALERGCTFLYSVTAIPAFQERLQEWGMVPVETGMRSFVLPLVDASVDFLKD